MSDLQCPVIVLVARHADVDGDRLSADGERQVADLADGLSDRRVSAVFTSPGPAARCTADEVARRLGMPVRELPGAGERLTQESEEAVVGRFADAVEEISDVFRGETVLLVTHGDVIGLALPRLSAPVPDDRAVPPGAVAEVHVDADGWALRSWPSAATAEN